MHEPLLAKAAVPAPTVCAEMLLRPYSIGHEVLLIRNESPFVPGFDSRQPQRADLITAVLICSQTWRENQTMHQDLFLPLKSFIWRLRMRGMSDPIEIANFIEYRQEGSLYLPESEISKPTRELPPRTPGAPFLLRLQQWLMRSFWLSEAAAWDYPLGLAVMRWETHWEQEGSFEIYNSDEAEVDRYAAEQDAIEAKKGEITCPA